MSKNDRFAPFREGYQQAAIEHDGPEYWRSLDHKRQTAESRAFVEREFPDDASTLPVDRRDVLKLMGASIALAGASGCVRRPEEEILPYTKQPEGLVPGLPLFFASAMPRPGGALGVVVESHEGRPTKIEGNPDHPSSGGRADVWAQATVLELYDPDRSRTPRNGGKAVSWADWDAWVQATSQRLQPAGGQGLHVLVDVDDSPTRARVLRALQERMPSAKLHHWDPLAADNMAQGAQAAFGPGARVHYDVSKADVILAVDSDFLINDPESVRHARGYAARRKIANKDEAAAMNRLYVVEGAFTPTGANADHRLRVPSSQCGAFLKALAAAVGAGGDAAAWKGDPKFLAAVAKDLQGKRGGKAIVLVGERQPAAVHALGHAINAALGAFDGGAATVSTPNDLSGGAAAAATPAVTSLQSLKELVDALNANTVDTLVVIGANPAYTAPKATGFVDAAKKAKVFVHAGLHYDETSSIANWHLPLSHWLESWGDARAWDGTASIVQPIIAPLHGTRSAIELLAQLAGAPAPKGRDLVEETWRKSNGLLADERAWRKALHDGVVPGTARPTGAAAVRGEAAALALPAGDANATEVVFLTGHALDGRLANVGWIQELPQNISKTTWDNALFVPPALAKQLGFDGKISGGVYQTDVARVTVGGASIEIPVYIQPGLAPNTVAVERGYGRRAAGVVADGVGVDVAPILPADGAGFALAKIEKAGRRVSLCTAQDHFSVEGNAYLETSTLSMGNRPLHRTTSLKMYQEKGRAAEGLHDGDIPPNLIAKGSPLPGDGPIPSKPIQPWNEFKYDGQQWGMAIDLTTCIGCSACTIACQSENNIPVVGRKMSMMNREMHWMRVDRYFKGDVDDPVAVHQPVNCMHCENAPCEAVCPVAATTHDNEGLNTMAYNRCIGTRYCSNNCPYKVRRFNYLDFTRTGNVYVDPREKERYRTLKMQRNPDVTVRYRGVIEKCTYCTQRIEQAKYAAKRKGQDPRALPDGAVIPACAQTCPTDAITFGNINDPNSAVARAKKNDRNYEMLNELNTRPRTTYVARLRNVNPELA